MAIVDLDPRLQTDALARCVELREEMQHHQAMANNAQAKIALLMRTWQLCALPTASGFCCNDPVECQGRQP